MFEDSLVESAALLRTHNRWPALLSITAQSVVAVLILSLPLLHPEMLPMPHILPATLAPPRVPVPPPPPIHLNARPSSAAPTALTAPTPVPTTQIFRNLIYSTAAPVDAPSLPVTNLGGADKSLPPGINGAAPSAPHVTVSPATTSPSRTPAISSGVSAGHLITPIRPDYPAIARSAGVGGTVVIAAIISRTGAITSAQVISGPPMLQHAALDAVRQARYRPFLLNGQPTDVQTTITIVFRLGS